MTEEKKHGPDCDCGCQEDVPKITLEFDDGEEIECEPLFIFDYQDQDYIALVPVDSTDEDVFLYPKSACNRFVMFHQKKLP